MTLLRAGVGVKTKQTNKKTFILWGNTGTQAAIELIDKGVPKARHST